MTSSGEPGKKLSTLSRVLAWVFIFCSLLGGAGWVIKIRQEGFPAMSGEVILALLSVAAIWPLFLYAALKGRSPRWMTSMEEMFDAPARRRGTPVTNSGASRRLMVGAASVVFGVILFAFGLQLGLFSSETGWFAMTVFTVAWLMTVIIMWRSFGRRPPGK
jgi:hypothetical protein